MYHRFYKIACYEPLCCGIRKEGRAKKPQWSYFLFFNCCLCASSFSHVQVSLVAPTLHKACCNVFFFFFFWKVKQNQPSLCLNSFNRSLPTSTWNLIWCPAFGICIFKVLVRLHRFHILLHVPGTLPSSPTYEKFHDVRNWVCCVHLPIFYT